MKDFFNSRFATLEQFWSTQQFDLNDLKNIFRWDYWTEANLLPQTPYSLASLLVILALVIGLFLWRRRLKIAEASVPIYAGPINQMANIIAFIIIVGASYAFFRSQAITYLSSRLVVLASLIIILGWIGWVIFYLVRLAPAKRRNYLEQERFFRYIPKSKPKVNGKTKNQKSK